MRNNRPVTFSTDLEPRKYFRTLDAALGDLGLPLGAVDKVRQVVVNLEYQHVYVPHTRDHIALERTGDAKPVAYITHQFMAIHPPNGASEFVQLADPDAAPPAPQPLAAPKTSARKAAAPAPASASCPSCFVDLPATGRCDWCD